MKITAGMISLALLLAVTSQAASAPTAPSAESPEAAILAGHWKALAEMPAADAVGHFARAAANGVLGNYRIMEDEFKRSKGGEAAVDDFCAGLLRHASQNGYAHFVAGVRLYDKGETEKAVSEYKAAITLAPQFGPAYVQIGLHHGQADNDLAQQMAWMDKAIEADPGCFTAYVGKGIACHGMGQQEAAVGQFKKAVEVLTAANISTGQPMAQACYNIGWLLLNQSTPDNDGGIAMMRKAIAADPYTVEAYTELGVAYKRKGQFTEAVATYKNGISRGAGGAKLHFNLGVAEYRSGNSVAAKAALQKAASLDPSGSVGALARQWLGQIQ